ncbi:hypothetical protein [Helicobacter japonicus]|uniref:hypothetical protein n=1 Tax=Helicobacter japonicus TaxID=425400 RepID=UPI002594D46C|nr:hypothetical protein [Helicobacter japonicus]
MLIATFFEAVGTILVQLIEIALLSKLLPFVMIAVGAYFFAFSKHQRQGQSKESSQILKIK